MATKLFPEQINFAAGELSPRLYGRTDLEARLAGLKSLINGITLPQGPVQRRHGFYFYDDFTGAAAKVFPFPIATDAAYWVVFTNASPYMFVVAIDGDNLTAITPTFTTTPSYLTAEIPFLQAELTPGGSSLYIVHQNHVPAEVIYTSGPAFEYDIITFTGTYTAAGVVTGWAASDYPGTVTFFQGRSVWAGTPSYPERVWLSDSADYKVFTTPSAAADSVDVTHTKNGAIKWIVGLTSLVLGTEFHEVILTGDDNLVINGNNIRFEIQSAFGSSSVRPVVVGDKLVYVSADGRKVRDMDYEWTKDRWVSRDIMYVSEHMTKNDRIVELAFAQNPYNLILAKTENGNLLIATYERGNDIIGWGQHSFTGELYALGVLAYQGTDRIGAIFDRGVVGGSLNWENLIEDSQLDCHSIIEHDPAADTITGLTHLANQTVGVKTDGAIHPDITLDGSGNGTLDWDAELIEIGFNYVWTAITLPPVTQLKSGSTRMLTKKWSKIFVQIIESAYPKINGDRPPSRTEGMLMDTAQDLITADIEVTSLGWDRTGELIITQDLPLHTRITAVYGELTVDYL